MGTYWDVACCVRRGKWGREGDGASGAAAAAILCDVACRALLLLGGVGRKEWLGCASVCVSTHTHTHTHYYGPDGVKRGMMKGVLCSPLPFPLHGPQTDTVGTTRVRTYVCRVRACVHVRRMWLALGAVWTGFVRWSLPRSPDVKRRELMVKYQTIKLSRRQHIWHKEVVTRAWVKRVEC